MDTAEAEAFLDHYYQSGSADRVPEALTAFVTSELLAQEHTRQLETYVFAKIAQLHPSVIRGYEKVFQEVPVGRTFILGVLRHTGDDHSRHFLRSCLSDQRFRPIHHEIERVLEPWRPTPLDALQWPVRAPGDLDFLWVDFCVTGNTQPVVRIIDVLEWPDRIRQRLHGWLRKGRILGFILRRTQAARRICRELGIDCDYSLGQIRTAEDLDCRCVLEVGWPKAERLLPFRLSAKNFTHIATKAAAKWSLGSNAEQHARVFATCEEELGKRTGRVRLALEEILAGPILARLREASEKRFAFLAELSSETASKESDDAPDRVEQVRRCLATTGSASSYSSQMTLKDAAHVELAEGDAMWWLEFAHPDRYQVDQEVRTSSAGAQCDRWINIGTDHYRSVGVWFKPSDRSLQEADLKISRLLKVDKYLEILRRAEPRSAEVYRYREGGFLLLCYGANPETTAVLLPDGFAWGDAQEAIAVEQILIWVDLSTGFLVKADVLMAVDAPEGNRQQAKTEQVFANYNEEMPIKAPRVGLEMLGR